MLLYGRLHEIPSRWRASAHATAAWGQAGQPEHVAAGQSQASLTGVEGGYGLRQDAKRRIFS
jgi:hypothetical protein